MFPLSGCSCRTRVSCGRPRPRERASTWTQPWLPAAPAGPAAVRTSGTAPTCSSRCTSTSTAWRSAASGEVGVCPQAMLLQQAGSGVRGQGLGPGRPPHAPALRFQCLEAAAACTSSTWAAVRGRPAGARRLPGAPCVCRCLLWAVSSWLWSVEPNTCPTGERWALWWALAWMSPGEPAERGSSMSSVSSP